MQRASEAEFEVRPIPIRNVLGGLLRQRPPPRRPRGARRRRHRRHVVYDHESLYKIDPQLPLLSAATVFGIHRPLTEC